MAHHDNGASPDVSQPRAPRNIVLLSDGTGSSAPKRTNQCLALYQALDLGRATSWLHTTTVWARRDSSL
jgi:hypothetical protein